MGDRVGAVRVVGETIVIPLSIGPSLDDVPARVLGDVRPGSDERTSPGIVVSLDPFIGAVDTANGVRVVLRIDVTLSDATVALDANLLLVSCSMIEGVTVACEPIVDEKAFVPC